MEVNFDDEVNEASAKGGARKTGRPVSTGELVEHQPPEGVPVRMVGSRGENTLGLMSLRVRQAIEAIEAADVEQVEEDQRKKVMAIAEVAADDLVRMMDEEDLPPRTKARILETMMKLGQTKAEKHTHLHQEKHAHQHMHWEGSQLQAAAQTAEEQDRLRKRKVEG